MQGGGGAGVRNEALNETENAMGYLDTYLLLCRHTLDQMVLESLSSLDFESLCLLRKQFVFHLNIKYKLC